MGRFDYVIVGGGTAGCVLAARLSEDPGRSVLVIEAGRNYGGIHAYPAPLRQANSSAYSAPGHPDSWSYTGHLTPEISYPITRGKLIGGSSAVNGAQFMRGKPSYYNEWADDGVDGWSFDEVLPYFKRSETDLDFGGSDVHGAHGPIPVQRSDISTLSPVSSAFVEAAVSTGFAWDDDINGVGPSGVGVLPHNAVDGVRQGAGVSYLDPAAVRSNLTILEETLVTRVLVVSGRAIGVEIVNEGRHQKIGADHVILCAGGLNTPQILMLSGIGPAHTLGDLGVEVVHDSPQVGKNLVDHATVALTYHPDKYPDYDAVALRPIAEVNLNFSSAESHLGLNEDLRMFPYLYSKRRMLTQVDPGSSGLRKLREEAKVLRPLRLLRAVRGSSARTLRREVAHRDDLALHCGLGRPISRGEIEIKSDDPTALPAIQYRYLTHPEDMRRMREVVRLGYEFLSHTAFTALGSKSTSLDPRQIRDNSQLDEWIQAQLGTSYHSAGTCRMGPESSSVVDERCNVWGIDRLTVADLSVFPRLLTGGPNASVVMVAERVAALIREEA